MNSSPLKRIEDVSLLRRTQFPEDAGPLAHPVRPVEYREINNFYTATVYEKGSELVRMLAGRLGQSGFRRGMDLYFERHDGEAATIEDFLAALGDANAIDLMPYLAWYAQSGTPRLHAKGEYDAETSRIRAHAIPTDARHARTTGKSAAADTGEIVAVRCSRKDAAASCDDQPVETEKVVVLDKALQRFVSAMSTRSLCRRYCVDFRHRWCWITTTPRRNWLCC